jgi:hypothetical protein
VEFDVPQLFLGNARETRVSKRCSEGIVGHVFHERAPGQVAPDASPEDAGFLKGNEHCTRRLESGRIVPRDHMERGSIGNPRPNGVQSDPPECGLLVL